MPSHSQRNITYTYLNTTQRAFFVNFAGTISSLLTGAKAAPAKFKKSALWHHKKERKYELHLLLVIIYL